VSSSSVCELHFHYCVYVPAPYDIYWILLLCSDVLCASDLSGKIAMWNLSLFRKNTTQLVLSEVIPTSFHSAEEPGITCMGFHSTTGVLFTGGLDGTIRFWRLNVDNEAYCLSRPPDHETKTAVGYALNGPTKHSPPKVVHTSEEARLRPPGGFPLMPDEVSVSSSTTFASDTISIQNYKLEKNLGQVVESFCAMQCSEDFLLTGDDSGEMLLWVCYSVPQWVQLSLKNVFVYNFFMVSCRQFTQRQMNPMLVCPPIIITTFTGTRTLRM